MRAHPVLRAYAILNLRGKPDGFAGRYGGAILERGGEIGGNVLSLPIIPAQKMDMDFIGAQIAPVGGVLDSHIDIPQAGEAAGTQHGAQGAEPAHGEENRARQRWAHVGRINRVDVAAPRRTMPVPEAGLGIGTAGERNFEGYSMN
jgi:hypothetical protein